VVLQTVDEVTGDQTKEQSPVPPVTVTNANYEGDTGIFLYNVLLVIHILLSYFLAVPHDILIMQRTKVQQDLICFTLYSCS